MMSEIDDLRAFADAVKQDANPDKAVSQAIGQLDTALAAEPVQDAPAVPVEAAPLVFTCPVCGVAMDPKFTLRTLAICGNCGATLVDDGSAIRSATYKDVQGLTAIEQQQMVRARASVARPGRTQR